ncbi:MAG: hypothetical protein CMJ75_15865 [Planctomycetaceae bacterium]|nr:hypothetical protein [Planctomycetaceae bacterium]
MDTRSANRIAAAGHHLRDWPRIVGCLVVVLFLCGVADACPTCKDALHTDPAQANLMRGYFWSILFMMSMPFVIFSSLGSYFYFQVRRARLLQSSQVMGQGQPSVAAST